MTKTVYLAGPITGLNFAGAVDWRNDAIRELADAGIKGLSPMRAKEYLKAIASDAAFTSDGDKYAIQSPLSTNRGITTRDRWDATRCDVLLVNFEPTHGKGIVSVGTVMEIAWADSKRIPIVCAMPEGNELSHGMVLEAIGFRVHTLREALDLVKAILV